MTAPKHPTRVICHHDPASLPSELHAQYEVRRCDPPADPLFFSDTVCGDLGPKVITLPLPEALNRPGRLVRDDAACGWRFESAGRHLEPWTGTATDAVGSPSSNRRCQDMMHASRDSADPVADLHDAIEAYASACIERSRDCATDDDVKRG